MPRFASSATYFCWADRSMLYQPGKEAGHTVLLERLRLFYNLSRSSSVPCALVEMVTCRVLLGSNEKHWLTSTSLTFFFFTFFFLSVRARDQKCQRMMCLRSKSIGNALEEFSRGTPTASVRGCRLKCFILVCYEGPLPFLTLSIFLFFFCSLWCITSKLLSS